MHLPVTTAITADLVRGALDLERTEHGLLPHRLPARARDQNTDPQLAMAESQPSGVRVAVRTRATTIELDVLPTKLAYAGAPPLPDGDYDMLVDGRLAGRASAPGGRVLTVDVTTGARTVTGGGVTTVRFDALAPDDKDVEIWLPHRETTELVALRTDAPVQPPAARGRRTWLHHGSSISHGSGAESPSTTWPAIAASAAGVDLVNLGFGGGALLDPFTARAIRDVPADLISLKIGINVVNADLLRLRALGPALHGFLDTVRDGHPTTPLLVVSALHCAIHERTPGPAAMVLDAGVPSFRATGDPAEVAAGRLTLEVVRTELARVVAERRADDPHLAYLDGRELYGEADEAAVPLPDALHPDADTHRLIGSRFAGLAFAAGGPFGAS